MSRIENIENELEEETTTDYAGGFFGGVVDVPTLRGSVNAIMKKLGYEAEIQTADKMVVLKRSQKARK